MKIKTEDTWWAKIYMSGPIGIAEQVCREECFREGLCVTIEPTRFIYTGGEETGYVVGLINYPRFPQSREAITERAEKLALLLLERTFQHSALLMTPDQTKWYTNREDK
jgi:hypothetical protein